MTGTERLRILHLTPSLGVGGAEQLAGHLMVGLSESNDVMGACLYGAANSSIEDRLQEAHIPLWHLNKRAGFDPRLFWALDRVFEQTRPDVVHTHLSVLRYALPGLWRHRVRAVVHTMHNLAEHETDTFGRMIQWAAFRRVVHPVAISREVAASVKRVYGLECQAVVPNCIPIASYQRGVADRIRWREKERFSSDAILFICVGRLEAQKNPMLLVQAFEALTDPRIHLIMLGEGRLHDRVTGYIESRRLGDRVHMLGKRKDVPECLAAADAFVLSSDWEGNPLAVIEAMAAGLPVISTAVGGVPELVESGRQGILVSAGDRTAFTAAMQALADNPSRRAEMAESARNRAASNFNVDRMSQGYLRFYEAVLAAGKHPRVPFPVRLGNNAGTEPDRGFE